MDPQMLTRGMQLAQNRAVSHSSRRDSRLLQGLLVFRNRSFVPPEQLMEAIPHGCSEQKQETIHGDNLRVQTQLLISILLVFQSILSQLQSNSE